MINLHHQRSFSQIQGFLPVRIAQALEKTYGIETLEEIRIRIGQKIQLCFHGGDILVPCKTGDPLITRKDCDELMERICFHSVYACEAQLKSGFITLPGGFRVGLAGRILIENGRIKRVEDPSSFNIRIACEYPGCADAIMDRIVDKHGHPLSTMILSPPGCGKTTLLRDIARQYSYGMPEISARRVCVVDERSEIAGSWNGIPQNDLGPRCDVLDSCPKSEGILLAIRALSPEVIVCDELGHSDDYSAAYSALHSGCAVYATAHSADIHDFFQKFQFYAPREESLFSRYLLLSRRNGPGTLEAVLDENGKPLEKTKCFVLSP